MAKVRSRKPKFTIEAIVTSIVTIDLEADNLADALEQSKGCTADDFLYDMPGDVIGHELCITGVREA